MHAATATLLVGAGGFLGAVARWQLGTSIKDALENPHFPYPTFAINLLGCLAIGIAYSLWETHAVLRLLVVVGFLGGFTTFSAFGLETLSLIRNGSVATAAIYVGLSTSLGVLLVWAGMKIAG
jgi:CrcB protein